MHEMPCNLSHITSASELIGQSIVFNIPSVHVIMEVELKYTCVLAFFLSYPLSCVNHCFA